MASGGEPNGMNASAADAAVSDGESSTAAGASPDRVLPLGVLEFKVPRCDDLVDTVDCACETIEWCVTEATARLAVAAADEAARGSRRVITAGDMERAIRGIREPDTVPGAVLRELDARAKEKKRADKLMRRQERASRKQAAGEEGAAAAAHEEQGPTGGGASGHQE